MNGTVSAEELSIAVLALMILLAFGLFFVLKGLRMPPNFEKNVAKRKELKQKREEWEEKNNATDGSNG